MNAERLRWKSKIRHVSTPHIHRRTASSLSVLSQTGRGVSPYVGHLSHGGAVLPRALLSP